MHVLTAVSRPRNLMKVAHSLCQWGEADYEWHLRFDLDKQHIGGQAVKNRLLETITDGWVWFLDDDTTAHPELYVRVATLAGADKKATAIVVDQERSDASVLNASRENVGVGTIDIGQVVIRRDRIADQRIPEEYAGDGSFLEVVLDDKNVVFVNETLSFHNRLEKR